MFRYPFDIFIVFSDTHGFIPDINSLCLFFSVKLARNFSFPDLSEIKNFVSLIFFYCFLFSILLKFFLLCLLLPSFYLLWIYFAFLFYVLKLGARLFTYKKWLLCVCVLVAQSCPTLCDSMICSPPGFSVHGILQARILEWIAIPFSRGTSQPRNQTLVSCIAGRFFIIWAIGKSQKWLEWSNS